MSLSDEIVEMYRVHPISASHILDKIGTGPHKPESLWPHDQDHYGGLEANAEIAARANMKPGTIVADFCAGLGGPARWYAHVHGLQVMGIDLTSDRVKGAAALNAVCGLADRVKVVQGSVTEAPLGDQAVDTVVSQEAFLHIPDYPKAVAEAFRVLRPGGRAVVSTLTSSKTLSRADTELLRRGLGFRALPSPTVWRSTFLGAGFAQVETEDLTSRWARVLEERLEMYLALRDETTASGHPTGDDWFHRAYPRFVDLVGAGDLGGILITASKS
ncbi:MAG: class I SAM-dependent methyltransferase [Pseudomonadota bacterium]